MRQVELDGLPYIVACHYETTQNQLTQQRLEAQAGTDSLTGLANRTHLDWFIDQEWRRAARSANAVSVLMIDIDWFKPLNDTYGHQTGDECLQRVAEALSGLFDRPSDLVARYGGDEFMIVLGQSNAADARINTRRVLSAVRELAIPFGCSEAETVVTVSIGVATRVPKTGEEPAMLIALADTALYEAKSAGRNHFMVAADRLDTPRLVLAPRKYAGG